MNRKVYRSMQGKIVDMELLSKANELTPAIGNVRMNARGDELGPGGQIIRKRDEIVSEYYDKTNSVRDEQFKKSPPLTNAKIKKDEDNSNELTKKLTNKKEVKNDSKEDKTDS